MSATTLSSEQASSPDQENILQRVLRNFLLRKIVQGILTALAVVSFTFVLIRLMPSNPVDVYIAELMGTRGMSYDEARNMAISLFAFNPDAPILEQYLSYVGNLLRGDLGNSIQSPGTKVIDILVAFLPWTLFCVGLALLNSFILGILLGMLMAYFRDTPLDYILSAVGSFLSSVPNYLIAILILVVFGVQMGLFRIADVIGGYSPGIKAGFTLEYILDILKHALLPMLTYIATTVGGWMLTMKGSTMSTLGEDYVNVAKARGLPDRRIVLGYVGRNAMLPLFTSLAVSIGFVVGGSVVIEVIFQYPGIGRRLFESISRRDYTVMQGVFLVITIAVVLSNLFADLLYSALDPRVRIEGEK
jgi:peptide/nickel transport system permease protein